MYKTWYPEKHAAVLSIEATDTFDFQRFCSESRYTIRAHSKEVVKVAHLRCFRNVMEGGEWSRPGVASDVRNGVMAA